VPTITIPIEDLVFVLAALVGGRGNGVSAGA
jgi:hypothetical protein